MDIQRSVISPQNACLATDHGPNFEADASSAAIPVRSIISTWPSEQSMTSSSAELKCVAPQPPEGNCS
ncbi:hypothetical protein [Mycobacterium kansasii]|uniref:hypothetical protein n=1 Tax=Mycobacterium kansasii TaxID=1768 RepID=UPI00115A1C42|nr:hypothetical protein [Mycobacterium kansasii]